MREAAITNILYNDDLEEVIALFLQSESEIITNDKTIESNDVQMHSRAF